MMEIKQLHFESEYNWKMEVTYHKTSAFSVVDLLMVNFIMSAVWKIILTT